MSIVSALQHLGYALDVDFVVAELSAGVVNVDWLSAAPQPTQAEIDAAMLPAAKARRIASINAECRARLIARFGDAYEQITRMAGDYGAAEQAAMAIGRPATIDASNVASNAILAAADLAAVEAVTVTWPVI